MEPVHQTAQAAGFNYALIEPWNLDQDFFGRPSCGVVCTPAMVASTHENFPWLIPLNELSDLEGGVLQELIDDAIHAQPPALCGLIASNANPEVLAAHIANLQLLRKRELAEYSLFRFYDPTVFAMLDALYSDRQRAHIFGPISEWRFPWARCWWQGTAPVVDLAAHVTEPTIEQWRLLQRADCVHKTLLAFFRLRVSLSVEQCTTYLRKALAGLDIATNQYGLCSPEDLSEFVSCFLRHGDDIWRHPDIWAALEELRAGTSNWSAVARTLTEVEPAASDQIPAPPH